MSVMWRKMAVGAAVIALLAFFAVACCSTAKSYETDKANKAIETANKLLKDYNELQEAVNANWDKVDALGVDVPGMEQRKVVLLEIQKQIQDQAVVLNKMIAEYKNARKLYLSEDMKTYFQMLINYTKKQEEVNALFKTGVDNRIKLADDIIAGGDPFKLATASDDAVNAINDKAAKTQSDAQALKDKADKFYKDKKLGGADG